MWHNQLEVLFPTHLAFKLLHSWIAGAHFLILGVVLLFTCPELGGYNVLCSVESGLGIVVTESLGAAFPCQKHILKQCTLPSKAVMLML